MKISRSISELKAVYEYGPKSCKKSRKFRLTRSMVAVGNFKMINVIKYNLDVV